MGKNTLISIDLGFGYVKAMNEKGEEVIFPSVANEETVDGFVEGVINPEYMVKFTRNNNEKVYSVGVTGLERDGERIWEPEVLKNKSAEPLIATAIGLLTNDEDQEVEVALGLPISNYRKQKDELIEHITGYDFDIEIVEKKMKKRIKITKAEVYMQGVAAFFEQYYDLKGEVKKSKFLKKEGKMLLVDVGYRTTDYLVMNINDGRITPSDVYGSFDDSGMKWTIEEVAKQLNREKLINISSWRLENEIENGKCTFIYNQKTIDFSEEKSKAEKSLAENLINRLKAKLQGQMERLESYALVGGGGVNLFAYFKKEYENIAILLDNSSFSNVRGFMAMSNAKRSMED